ncbi:hypothetical protein X975_08259, partial [Stegodyphus mimosarum]
MKSTFFPYQFFSNFSQCKILVLPPRNQFHNPGVFLV